MSETGGTITLQAGSSPWTTQSAMLPAIRIGNSVASAYRLAKKPNGDLILQGRFDWTEGLEYGHEWRDIPTVEAA